MTSAKRDEQVHAALGCATPAEPPARLRERLLKRVESSPRTPGVLLNQDGLLIASSDRMAWITLAPGIDYKEIHVDAARKYSTMLVRMEAGARYPSHRHNDVEELFLISGDLHVAGETMRSGDYCRAERETVHDETFSEGGCVFLLKASQENEVVA